jgi:hypothetical protein
MKDLKITKGEIEGLIKDWEQFKTQNWYESDAVDVESYLRSEFAEIAARRLLYRMRDLLPPELLKQRDELEAKLAEEKESAKGSIKSAMDGLIRVSQQNEALLEALKELVHLHGCEQEGLLSGQPTPEQWYKAVEKAELIITKAEER